MVEINCGADPRIIGEHSQQLKDLKEGQGELWSEIKEFRKENKEEIKDLTLAIRELIKSTEQNAEIRLGAIELKHVEFAEKIAEALNRGKRNENWILWANRICLVGGASAIFGLIWQHVTKGIS